MAWLCRRLIIFFAIPAALLSIAFAVSYAGPYKYSRGIYEFLAFLLLVDLAFGLCGHWRNIAIVFASTIFGLSTIEIASAAMEPGQEVYARGFSVSRPIVGWGPAAAGTYHSVKTAAGKLIFDVTYTIDENLIRKTLSGKGDSSIAFFGDSFTFGEGLQDSETLPQYYADLTGRKQKVYNFGFPGYGPQQFLHVIESGIFDRLLSETKIFVYETAAWHAERAACVPEFVSRAPRYLLRDGIPIYAGSCKQGAWRAVCDFVVGSALFRRFVRPIVNRATAADVELYLAELKQINELVNEKYGARLVILYIAGNDSYLSKSKFTDAKIEKTLKAGDIEFIDATLSRQNFPTNASRIIPGDGHPSALANRVRAKILADYLSSGAAAWHMANP